MATHIFVNPETNEVKVVASFVLDTRDNDFDYMALFPVSKT